MSGNAIGDLATGRRPQEIPVRAALYVRVSTQEQSDRWGLPAQRRVLQDLATSRDWDAVLYDEGGASAETIEARPVLQRLLADVSAQHIDLVAVVEMERLCRASDLRDWATITSTFREAGVLVATPERIFNLEAAEDDFEADLRGILSKREKRKLLERTARGIREAKDAGKYAGGSPPTGYRYDHATRKIVPDPEVIPLVRRVFESDLSHWRLARELHAEGFNISYQTIQRMRQNPTYIGLRPNSQGELIQADWKPIVDEELWEKWQGRPQAARRSSRDEGPQYLLSGIARCASCGGPVVGTSVRRARDGTRLYSYKCYYSTRCSGTKRQLPGWLVDMLVIDALEQYVGDADRLKQRFRDAMDAAEDPHRAEQRKQLAAELQGLEDRQSRLVEAVETGTLPDHTVRSRLTEIRTRRREIDLELEALYGANSIPSLRDIRSILALVERLPETPNEVARPLLEGLVTAVEMAPPSMGLLIRWKLGGESRYRVPKLTGGIRSTHQQIQEYAAERVATYRVS